MSSSLAPEQIQSDKERLEAILSGSEYNLHPREEHGSLLGKLLNRLIEKIGNLMPEHAMPQSFADILSYLLIIVVIGLFIYLVVWLARRFSRNWRTAEPIPLSEAQLKLGYRDYLRQAESAGGKGDYSEGVRLIFLALLFLADSRGWLKVEKWKANGEYAMELSRSKPELRSLFREASLMFDQVYYGSRPAEQAVYAQLHLRISGLAAEEGGRHG